MNCSSPTKATSAGGHLDDQVDQAVCLTLISNAAVLWTTTYQGDALDALRVEGYPVSDEAAAHLTPAQPDHINFYGTYSFDVETELPAGLCKLNGVTPEEQGDHCD